MPIIRADVEGTTRRGELTGAHGTAAQPDVGQGADGAGCQASEVPSSGLGWLASSNG
jgi:hypothetical protein